MKAVITTINPPSEAVKKLASLTDLIVVGDRKTPEGWHYEGVEYYPIERQNDFSISKLLPENHYCRKNIGYLLAMKSKAESILDIDDDTYPMANWIIRDETVEVEGSMHNGWFNVYKALSQENIWPRGFSLTHLGWGAKTNNIGKRRSSIQQGLVDGDPDVDAIWRLVLKKEHFFKKEKSIYLNPFSWCPFNSQCTLWFPRAYALLYLPVTVSFRMTDIWRSFIAQRCLWAMDDGVTFHSPSEFFQDRNKHDLLKDFEDEISGYLYNNKIIEVLGGINLLSGDENICKNLLTCYQSLADENIIAKSEIHSVVSWIEEYKNLIGNG